MVWLIVLLIAAFTAGDVLGLEMSLAPGLSIKNAVLYLIAFTLVFRKALGVGERVGLVSIHVAFVLLIGYATLSWLVAGLLIQYPGYDLLAGAISLKSRMIDPALMLFAALYGLREMREVQLALKWLLAAIAFSSVATLLDVAGLMHLGLPMGESGAEEGRVFGAFGHANDTGALIVCMLPALFTVAFVSRGTARALWLVGAMASFIVLVMTVSRGAFVGLTVGSLLAAFFCRRYVPFERVVAMWFGVGVLAVLGVLLASTVDPQIGGTLVQRLLGQSTSVDLSTVSSGRTAIWAEALERMFRTPTTLLTGFGWGVYFVMPFRFAPHNYYLGLGFDLGIFAVLLVLSILGRAVVAARSAVEQATPAVRAQLLAFVFGIMGLAVTIIFADLYKPWAYIWLYMGIVLKAALLSRETAPAVVSSKGVEEPAVRASIQPAGVMAHPSRPWAVRSP